MTNIIAGTEMMAAALGYAAAGLPVLPLECQGKRPLGGQGKDHASTDPEVIRAWWARWGQANVGVVPLPGLIVVDTDPRHGGDVALAELERRHGRLPETLTAESGRGDGGLHRWFAYRGPLRATLAEGVDVKSCAGYVVAPPSVHESGGRYRWLNRSATAPAPAWVRSLLAPAPAVPIAATRKRAACTGLVRTVENALQGNRNHALYWCACRLAEQGADAEQYQLLADAAGASGLGEAEVRGTIASARRRAGWVSAHG